MKLQYNSPVVLTYAIICSIVMVGSNILGPSFHNLFILNGHFQIGNPIDYFKLLSYTVGHANWTHLIGNFALILIVGPILEEKYTSRKLLLMMIITAITTALINIILFNDNILGASGIVFMLILLSSFSSFKKGSIPLTFVLVFVLYIGREIFNAFKADQISQFGHIMGGICGAYFGFLGKKKIESESNLD